MLKVEINLFCISETIWNKMRCISIFIFSPLIFYNYMQICPTVYKDPGLPDQSDIESQSSYNAGSQGTTYLPSQSGSGVRPLLLCLLHCLHGEVPRPQHRSWRGHHWGGGLRPKWTRGSVSPRTCSCSTWGPASLFLSCYWFWGHSSCLSGDGGVWKSLFSEDSY